MRVIKDTAYGLVVISLVLSAMLFVLDDFVQNAGGLLFCAAAMCGAWILDTEV